MINAHACQQSASAVPRAPTTTELPIDTFDPAILAVPHEGAIEAVLPPVVPEAAAFLIGATVLAAAGRVAVAGKRSPWLIALTGVTATCTAFLACALCLQSYLIHRVPVVVEVQRDHDQAFALLSMLGEPMSISSRLSRDLHPGAVGMLREWTAGKAVKRSLETRQLALAETYSTQLTGTSEGARLRLATHLAIAEHALHGADIHAATAALDRARDLNLSDPKLTDAYRVLTAHLGFASVAHNDYGLARHHLDAIAGWRPAVTTHLAQFAVQARTVDLATRDAMDASDVEDARIYIGSLFDYVRRDAEPPLSIQCALASVEEVRGELALQAGHPELAVVALQHALTLVEDAPRATELLPVAYQIRGLHELERGQSIEAVVSLDKAIALQPKRSAPLREPLYAALMSSALAYADIRRFQDARNAAARAHGLKPSDATLDRYGLVHLLQAENSLRTGDVSAARGYLRTARQYGKEEVRSLVAMHEADLPAWAARAGFVRRAGSWVSAPAIAGQLCSEGCATVAFFDATGSQIGSWSRDKPGEVVFRAAGGGYNLLMDTNSDQIPDYWQVHEGGRDIVTLDSDRDSRPDLRLYYTSGQLTHTEALSGRIAFRVAAGAIAVADLDPGGGRPDPYFVLARNGRSIARSETIQNSFYPTWREVFVEQYNHGDWLRVSLWDADLFVDDPIDHLDFTRFPTTGLYRTSRSLAALDVIVQPSQLPAGYRYQGATLGNVFRSTPSEAEGMADILARVEQVSKSSDMSRTITSLVGSELLALIVAPELGLLGTFAVAVAADYTLYSLM